MHTKISCFTVVPAQASGFTVHGDVVCVVCMVWSGGCWVVLYTLLMWQQQ